MPSKKDGHVVQRLALLLTTWHSLSCHTRFTDYLCTCKTVFVPVLQIHNHKPMINNRQWLACIVGRSRIRDFGGLLGKRNYQSSNCIIEKRNPDLSRPSCPSKLMLWSQQHSGDPDEPRCLVQLLVIHLDLGRDKVSIVREDHISSTIDVGGTRTPGHLG